MMSRSELKARVQALEADLDHERAARRAAEAAGAEAAELQREVTALQRLVHMSKEGRIAYAERQRRRTDGGRAIAKLKRQLQARFHPDRQLKFSTVTQVLPGSGQQGDCGVARRLWDLRAADKDEE